MHPIHGIQDSVVGIVTMRRVRRFRVPIPVWVRGFFLHQKYSHWFWGPEGLLSNGYRVTFPEIRRSGRDVRHLTTSSVDLKNEWSYTSTPPICFQGVDRVNVTLRIPNIKTRKYQIWKSHKVRSSWLIVTIERSWYGMDGPGFQTRQ